jgi:hypothetical protein
LVLLRSPYRDKKVVGVFIFVRRFSCSVDPPVSGRTLVLTTTLLTLRVIGRLSEPFFSDMQLDIDVLGTGSMQNAPLSIDRFRHGQGRRKSILYVFWLLQGRGESAYPGDACKCHH